MFRLAGTETSDQEIKKSRFRAVAGAISDEESAKAFITAHSDPAANHNCWAWRIGQNYRFNDDGEPSGTAGKPILQAIDGQSLDHAVVVVTRWFGGILLGSGGLMRAYGGTAAACLRAAEKVVYVSETEGRVACGFSDLALVKARLAASPGVRIVGETYLADGAELVVVMPEVEADEIVRRIVDLTSGRSHMKLAD
ncbi:YigZ family protein [Rhizobium sp. KVB221]|uniref:YigZ family protein n=1 Tax=Rhizobium setariae TaxID=2801340 RepID=A0A936YTQ5_9HYPH|nr:YigZ family protein [Rhizobium setariae]MBL0372300.1 YigZ family protein [Rhizobium setariae]